MTATGFRHEAVFYDGDSGFLDATVPFIRDGVAAGEPILVMVSQLRIDALRARLGDESEQIHFADMSHVGANPARIIPAWRDFVDEQSGSSARMRGIGEPIWPGRNDEELVECHQHEALLNLAFADAGDFWLICPYDARALAPAVLDMAWCTHPAVSTPGAPALESPEYSELQDVSARFGPTLPAPPADSTEMPFGPGDTAVLRQLVGGRAAEAGMDARRIPDVELAITELVANCIRHGAGHGLLRMWRQGGMFVCDVLDSGQIDDPLVGRRRPSPGQMGGYGLWLVNQLCDLVQMRTGSEGSAIRVHVRCG
jgi:anti-sigma regulatory factor (Ser/Thr protein kinase)